MWTAVAERLAAQLGLDVRMRDAEAMDVDGERLAREPEEVVQVTAIVREVLEHSLPRRVRHVLPREREQSQPDRKPRVVEGAREIGEQFVRVQRPHSIAEHGLELAVPGVLKGLHLAQEARRAVDHSSSNSAPRRESRPRWRMNSRTRSVFLAAGR